MKPCAQELPFGYCTNVHAGANLLSALAEIDRHATQVRSRLIPDGRLPLGLWFSQSAAEQIVAEQRFGWLSEWLAERELTAYTFNGFPQGDFHQPVVKHTVYQPTWTCQSRATYTQQLAQILESLLPEGGLGSISTLPLGWPHAPWHSENFSLAADFLLATARYLHRLSEKRGCEIVLAIEPEPGCVLETAEGLVEFFQRYLLRSPDAELARQHLTVCHDICHSGVMFEPQQKALETYFSAGIRVGKVQVSSAIHVPWDQAAGDAERRSLVMQQLSCLQETKYLHQTTACNSTGKLEKLAEDLPQALEGWTREGLPLHPWRIHFHVPVYVDQFGELSTTRSDIMEACQYLEEHRQCQISGRAWFTGHYEVETYAWPVLPPELAVSDLAEGIAKELEFFNNVLAELGMRYREFDNREPHPT